MQLSDYQLHGKVKKLSFSKGMTLKDVSEQIGMTEQGMYLALKRGTIKLETLIQISNLLNVDVNYFLSNENTLPSSGKEENKYLMDFVRTIENQVKEKEQQLKIKDEQISQLLATNNALVMASLGKDEPVLYKDRLAA
jgi:transcriptional regulator with XRE-family HTH domain